MSVIGREMSSNRCSGSSVPSLACVLGTAAAAWSDLAGMQEESEGAAGSVPTNAAATAAGLIMEAVGHRQQHEQASCGLLAREMLQHASTVAQALGAALIRAARAGCNGMTAWVLEQLNTSGTENTMCPLQVQARHSELQAAAPVAAQQALQLGHAGVLSRIMHTSPQARHALIIDGEPRLGQRALLAAAAAQHSDCVRALVAHGALPGPALLTAARAGDTDSVRALLTAGSVDSLSMPAGQGKMRTPQWQLPPVMWRGCELDAALCEAAAVGSVAAVQALLQTGADPNALHGLPLREACKSGSYALVRLLLEQHGARADVVPASQLAALARSGLVELVLLLRSHSQS
jgi:hypothetical protein